MDKLRFGTAGIPLSAPVRSTLEGIQFVRELGLDAMELEFVHSIHVSHENAPLVKMKALESGIVLTCHGQYFINLNSDEEQKRIASRDRILNAANTAWMCGAESLTFHAAYYMKKDPLQVYAVVRKSLEDIVQTLRDNGNNMLVRPETTGKHSQFGTLDELVKLASEVDGVLPCIDFAHLHARSNGKINSYNGYSKVLETIEDTLGRRCLDDMHTHCAGIEYSEKGERRHLNLQESDFNYVALMKAFKHFNVKGVIICESPNIEEDALLMKKTYDDV